MIVSRILAKTDTNANPAIKWTPLHIAAHEEFEVLLRSLLIDGTPSIMPGHMLLCKRR